MKSATRATGFLLALLLAAIVGWAGVLALHADPPAPPDAARMDRLIRQLGSEDFAEREAAGDALLASGRFALRALQKGAESGDAEIHRRSLALIGKIDEDAIALRDFGAAVEVDADRPDQPVVSVELNCWRAAEAPLAHLGRLDSLLKVTLRGPYVSDSSLDHLSGLKHLRELSLANTPVTDKGLASLSDLKELEHLDLCGTKVAGEGLKHLRGLDRLEILYLDRTAVADKGLEHLEGLTGLAVLRLAKTHVTDAGLKHLKGMLELRLLDLSHTAVTDAGLSSLAGLHELRRLDLIGTAVTPQGIEDLARSLPKLEKP